MTGRSLIKPNFYTHFCQHFLPFFLAMASSINRDTVKSELVRYNAKNSTNQSRRNQKINSLKSRLDSLTSDIDNLRVTITSRTTQLQSSVSLLARSTDEIRTSSNLSHQLTKEMDWLQKLLREEETIYSQLWNALKPRSEKSSTQRRSSSSRSNRQENNPVPTSYRPASPAYVPPASPAYRPRSPAYAPTSPAYARSPSPVSGSSSFTPEHESLWENYPRSPSPTYDEWYFYTPVSPIGFVESPPRNLVMPKPEKKEEIPDDLACGACYDAYSSVFYVCGHKFFCEPCNEHYMQTKPKVCPICRTPLDYY